MLLLPRWRARLLRSDKSYLTPFMVVVCAVVLYGQAARFSTTYGAIGNPVFWVAGAMLIGPGASWALIGLLAIVAYPLLPGVAPRAVYDAWSTRPPVANRVVVPGLNRIPIAEDGGPASMAALIAEWRALGLDGRATVDVELRNDVAWGNDAIVGYLLNAPAAAWPLTYDPGLVNTPTVELETVSELCRDRAPVVQNNGDYPYPAGKPVYVGSRVLDEFLAVDYGIRAVAGFYRIVLSVTSKCELPEQLSTTALTNLGNKWLGEGQLAEAGALAIARLERAHKRHEVLRASDAALAALGGYALAPDQVPVGELGSALRALAPTSSAKTGLASAAAHPWPSDIERLAAETAWMAFTASRGKPDAPGSCRGLRVRPRACRLAAGDREPDRDPASEQGALRLARTARRAGHDDIRSLAPWLLRGVRAQRRSHHRGGGTGQRPRPRTRSRRCRPGGS